jgi:hypothetical protein
MRYRIDLLFARSHFLTAPRPLAHLQADEAGTVEVAAVPGSISSRRWLEVTELVNEFETAEAGNY